MPNGRPGDHPFTDILHYGSSEFGEPVDGLVKEIATLPGFSSASDEVANILWELSPMGRAEQREQLTSHALNKLQLIKERLLGVE